MKKLISSVVILFLLNTTSWAEYDSKSKDRDTKRIEKEEKIRRNGQTLYPDKINSSLRDQWACFQRQ